MVKKAAEKTAGIDMSKFQARSKPSPLSQVFDGQTPAGTSPLVGAEPVERARSFTGVSSVIAGITSGLDTAQKLNEATKKLAEFEGARWSRPLDPKSIVPSKWANRIEAEFSTDEFLQLKEEISNAGGNVQAIEVRTKKGAEVAKGVFDGQTPMYEVVFGHRRHRACLELGIPVNAIVVEELSDLDLFEAMDRENRARKNLSAWEQGRMYENALKNGLYRSIRQLVERLGVNLSDASRAIQLAKLPKEVVAAFPSPLEIQVRWAKPLADALQRDPDGVLVRARQIGKANPKLSAADVFGRLIGKTEPSAEPLIEVSASGKRVATIKDGSKGRVLVEFEADVLSVDKRHALATAISAFLESV